MARILAELHLDAGSIKAALLHDVLEDTRCTLEDINGRFGEDVALLVDGVSKLDKLRFDSAVEAQAESFRKMLLAMVQDLRVILVKLADRTHNMRTIEHLPAEKQRRIAKETLEIYAPIANRLGMYNLKVELEDLGFRAYMPFRYRVLDRALRRSRGNQRQFLRRIVSNLKKRIAERGIEARLVAREKRLYSIYSKMRRKHIPLSEIVDVFGVRIIVADIDTCYRTLGLVHGLHKPMPDRFRDYISIPRVNGYQSLHTTLFGPKSMPLEVQIRTEEMDQVAERGIAAHWQHKAVEKRTHGAEARAREWLQNLMEMQQAANSEEFLETVKTDLFPDKVYVFTPKGDIMRLPRGATAVDFAYAVHTAVGNRCKAAKIARREVPLNTTLNNGDTVEIVTARSARPNPNWVNFVTTGKARNAIRAYLKNLKREEARDLGKTTPQPGPEALLPEPSPLAKGPARAPDRGTGHIRNGRSLRTGRAWRASGAGRGRHAGAATGRGKRHRGHAETARNRRNRRAAGELRGLLPPDTRRRHRGLHVQRTRRHHPSRQVPQRRGLSQATREVDSGGLAPGRFRGVPIGDSRQDPESRRPARRCGGPNFRDLQQHSARQRRITRRRVHAAVQAERARPPPPGPGHAQPSARIRKWSASRERRRSPMAFETIRTATAPAAIGTYSQAVRAGETVYLSGQIPLDPDTMELVAGGIDAQIRQVFDNLAAVAQAAGGGLGDIVKLTVYLTDLGHFPGSTRSCRNTSRSPTLPAPPSAWRRCRRRQRLRWTRFWLSDHADTRSSALARPVAALRGVGPRIAERLSRLGVERIADLLCLLPLRYEDRTRIRPLGGLNPGERVLVEGEVELAEVAFRRRRSLLCRVADGTGAITLRFFHFNRVQQQQLVRGTHVRCFGDVRNGPTGLEMIHPGIPHHRRRA